MKQTLSKIAGKQTFSTHFLRHLFGQPRSSHPTCTAELYNAHDRNDALHNTVIVPAAVAPIAIILTF